MEGPQRHCLHRVSAVPAVPVSSLRRAAQTGRKKNVMPRIA